MKCKITRYGATESGILGYQITVIQRHIQQIFQGSEGSETNLAQPTPPLKAPQRQPCLTENKLDNDIKNCNVRLAKGQATDNKLLNMLIKSQAMHKCNDHKQIEG